MLGHGLVERSLARRMNMALAHQVINEHLSQFAHVGVWEHHEVAEGHHPRGTTIPRGSPKRCASQRALGGGRSAGSAGVPPDLARVSQC